MGCDGGTIPTRDEMVKLKKKPEKKDQDSVRAFKWKHCSLSHEALRTPLVACELGKIYSKESVIELLLDNTKFQGAERVEHIQGLKDVKSLQLTPNPAYKDPEGDKGGAYVDHNSAPYICPITGVEMNGKYRFCYLYTCNCVFAERALKEIKSETCNSCGIPFTSNDIIVLNGTDEDVARLTTRMEERKKKAKLEKKMKRKQKAEITLESAEDGPTTSKQTKTDAADQTTSQEATTSSEARSGALGKTAVENGKLVSGKKTEKSTKPKSIQKDPKASAAYKSLFTTSEGCKKQPKAHWVTFNPCYY